MTKVLEKGNSKPEPSLWPVDVARIERLAYSYWEGRGYRGNSSEEDWLRAEQDLSCSGPEVEWYNPTLAAEGRSEKLAGKVQEKIGQTEKVPGK